VKRRVKRSNPYAVAMRKRHPRMKIMTSRNKRRGKDARNSWRRDIERNG
jgi:hypothetical protein